ncbi:nucleoside diphosphate-linked moiety X motif 17 isoform 2-T3 [Synchiropus picturatus]
MYLFLFLCCGPGQEVMDKVRRVLVHVCRDRSSPQRVNFVQSVTGYFSRDGEDEVDVSCSLEKNQFFIHRGEGPRVPLKRPAFCPIKHLSVTDAAMLPQDVQQQGVDVGVSVILQSANHKVLLTRRPAHLRIFPNNWVPPGGHVEPDETLLEAGLRELQEETGVKVAQEEVRSEILGLWESTYPPMLSCGLPRRRHIVVFVLLRTLLPNLQLQESLRPSPAEVNACVWVDADLARLITSSMDGEDRPSLRGHLPGSIRVTRVSSDGSLSDSTLPGALFLNRVPVSGPDEERVSTGTKFALDLWLRSLEGSDQAGR